MDTETFERTNLNWQFFLLETQVREWLDYQFSRLQKSLPKIPEGWTLSPELIELLTVCFWLILGIFVIWVIWRLCKEFNPYLYAWLGKWNNSDFSTSTINYQEYSINVLLTQSQEFYQQGNYQEACRYLYLAMLQQLHEKAIALQQPSRTDGEYLQLLTSILSPIQPYEILITIHEKLCFSQEPILVENYQQCLQAYEEINS